MDIRSKNIRYSTGIKVLAAVICISGVLLMGFGLLKAQYFENAFEKGEYLGSGINARILDEFYNYAFRTAFIYKSIENIKSPDNLPEILPEYQRQISENMNRSIASVNSRYSEWINTAIQSGNEKEAARLTEERDKLIQVEQLRAGNEIEMMKEKAIQDQLDEFHTLKARLEKADGIYYYAKTPDGTVLSNTGAQSDVKAFFKGLPAFMAHEPWEENNQIRKFRDYALPSGGELYVGMSGDRFLREQQAYKEQAAIGLAGIFEALAGFIIALAGFCYVLYTAGRRPGLEGIQLLTIDRLYLDAGLAILIMLEALFLSLLNGIWRDLYKSNSMLFYIFASLTVSTGTVLALAYFTMAARRFKRRELLRYNLIYLVPAYVFRLIWKYYRLLKSLLSSGPAIVKNALQFSAFASAVTIAVIITAGFAVSGSGSGVFFGVLLVLGINIAALIYVLKKAKALSEINAGVFRIRSGNFSSRIAEEGGEDLSSLAENINHVADGLKAAVENEVKAERLKAELVTNVSHDLKTPLTSIITYIDLLKTEGFQSGNAAKYLEILEQKSNRLKTLTEDLFEAAKAASGNIAVNLETLDIGALLVQGMGELSDKIEASGLDFKINIPEEKLFVKADGRLLWRVIENLLSNVFKYALPLSRVYIDAAGSGNSVQITIKNISAYELNISADELTERFKRGDQSRRSEGSGLGLSIAKSLTELQGGTFKIDIDGDLFKATVILSASSKG